MVALTQVLMSYAVITPILRFNGLTVATPLWSLMLLVLGTVLITMGGYIINDYFDTKIDEINKPHKVLVGKAISRQKVIMMHQVITGLGMLCGLVVAWHTRSITIGMIFIFIPGLLWFYSTAYKRQFLVGNLIVGLITAFVPMVVALLEQSYLVMTYGEELIRYGVVADIYKWVGFFAIFAFCLTILREMVKDLQDEKGDRELECRTVPIVLGANGAKVIITILSALLIFAVGYLVFVHISYSSDSLMSNFLLYGICGSLLFFVFVLIKAQSPKDYAFVQNILKLIMLAGVLFSLVLSSAV